MSAPHTPGKVLGDVFMKGGFARIEACVSACEGLADPSVVPELLAALKDAVALTDRNLPNFNGLRTAECQASYARCKSAIKKAESR